LRSKIKGSLPCCQASGREVRIIHYHEREYPLMLEPGGMYMDLELKIVAAIKPRPAFLPILRMLDGIVEYDETKGLLLLEHWCDRNRRDSNPRSSA